ncbi:hypothetical protein HETIRDRAFT_456322 [Heterobasidion irregulare TC 32-1]|uniref:DUF6533 domain-containing protein n=1 Tax=Heterobasidion irregulare (strain TC 32-1) TaxID=747525 RepID=W4JMP3_HETIT|nr:uncharacterized protein HETIRDRAFT_456322 [Heterobasidion irregulare TC 32-1]ETW74783.1 hypothetical protein HETIRDRAFT_456322 [Heterobasidion irregulare TC 32-1]
MADQSAVLVGLQHLNIETYVNACAITILAYDYLLTLPYEIKYMWTQKWSLIKVLFFLTRYPVFFDTYNSVTIFRLKFAMPFTALLDGSSYLGSPLLKVRLFFAMHRLSAHPPTLKGIIIMRTWAIWGRRKSIGIFLISLFTASLITACVCLALFEKSTRFVPISTLGPLSTGKGCLADRANIDVVGTYASFTVFDTVIVILTVIKGLQLRELHPSHSNLFLTLYRDGMLFYVTLFVIVAVATDLMLLLLGLQRVLYSVLSARILFHIHQAVEPPPMSFAQNDMPMKFAVHRTPRQTRDQESGASCSTDVEMAVFDVR